MAKAIDIIPFTSPVRLEWDDMFKSEILETAEKQDRSLKSMFTHSDHIDLNDLIEGIQTTSSIYDSTLSDVASSEDIDAALSKWTFVGPHSDMEITKNSKKNATDYIGPRYIAFYFLKSDGHVLQSGFKEDNAYWSMDNMSQEEVEIGHDTILVLDTHETHALGYKNNEHFKYINANRDEFISLFTDMPLRTATALAINYETKPTLDVVLQDFEKVMQNMMDLSMSPKPF